MAPIRPDKPYPSSTTKASAFNFTVPPGWKCIMSSASKKSHKQAFAVEYQRDMRRVRAILEHEPGSVDEKLRNRIDGSTVTLVRELHETSNLVLKWYVDQIESSRIAVKKIVDGEDEVVYDVEVFGQAESANSVQVTTIRFNRVDAGPRVASNNPPRLHKVPGDDHVNPSNTSDDLPNLENIQGDIIPGLPKALEYFYYFQITNVAHFRQAFASFALARIVTSSQVVLDPPPPPPVNPTHPFLGFNVAFSSQGIRLFGLDPAEIGDAPFLHGQKADSQSLGDPGCRFGEAWSPDWDLEFQSEIHGIFIITAYTEDNALRFIWELERAFRFGMKKIVNVHAHPRPGANVMNDPFGYRGGGISNPQVKGVTFTDARPMRFKGTVVIPIGVIVMGREGDEDGQRRPAWAVDGSLIATRKLNCLVPEFEAYCLREGMNVFPNLPPDQAATKLGARLMGRWKNGTAVAMSPDHDAPEIANDDSRVNNFEFDQSDTSQRTCPFAAHMRKSNPRNDVPKEEQLKHLVRRQNLPYGPELTDEERAHGTRKERGLHMCIYQSSIERGFRFVQRGWYNEPNFPPGKSTEPGWDPVFGQTGDAEVHRYMSGVDPTNPSKVTTIFDRFIDPRGGEYFFAPSLKTLREYIAVTS
ncbi:hypothetical protein C8R45DRAFT_1216747 [Mycena sanguinolenta]|nr:hypothetical protein C8R45DRAFT_1216747 [Mycena sanguinolenta]